MAKTINKWQIWCNTDNKWEEVWSEFEPNTCPVNNTHSIDVSKISIIDTVANTYPVSPVGDKMYVHNSPRPTNTNHDTYIVWTGCGDDVDNHILGGNDANMLIFQNTTGTYGTTRDVKFDPIFGAVYIHEGYLSWKNAGVGDHFNMVVMAEASQLQTMANLMLTVDENGWVYPAAPGTATHGFAANPQLLPRSFSQDGQWDYDAINGLTPNLTNNGAYKISIHEQPVHRFVNRLPVMGTNSSYIRLSSTEAFLVPPNYFIRFESHNGSDTNWEACIILAIFRERTFQP
jgi:hypothetical protein